MKSLLLTLALACTALLRAALPAELIDALLSPSLTETVSGKSWQVTTRERWLSSPMQVSERGGITTTRQPGAGHPSGWVTTDLTLAMVPPTPEAPQPMQTFTLTATPAGIVPRTSLVFTFLNEAELPPCTVRTWKGLPAIVATAGDWYIIAKDPAATITQSHQKPVKTTLSVAGSTEKRTPLSAAILLGEGPLPPEK